MMRDFNARVGEGSDGKVIGKYGLGKRNDRGKMLSEFGKKESARSSISWYILSSTYIVSAEKETAIHMDCSSLKREGCDKDCS
jgi:hypothetical protein